MCSEAQPGVRRVSLRPVSACDLATIDRWASGVADFMSRTRPLADGATRHDPDSGLFWYVIAEEDRDVGTVWIELLSADSEWPGRAPSG